MLWMMTKVLICVRVKPLDAVGCCWMLLDVVRRCLMLLDAVGC